MFRTIIAALRKIFAAPRCRSTAEGCTAPAVDKGHCRAHADWLRQNTTVF